MERPPNRLVSLFRELKRRHVLRVVVAYVVVAAAVLEIAGNFLPAFGYGSAALRVVLIVAVLGLPFVAALAWVYDITPAGIRATRAMDAEAGTPPPPAGGLALRVAFLVVTTVAVFTGGWWWIERAESGPGAGPAGGSGASLAASDEASGAPIRSLVVLPLESFAADDRDYFTAGMHEALVSQLGQLESVRVLSRTSAVNYDRTGKTAPVIGRELGVEGIVEGSVLRDGHRVRITVQLIHAPSDRHLWAADYERELDDIIALQGEVARAIATEIAGELAAEEMEPVYAAGEDDGDVDPRVADAVLEGRYHLYRATPDEVRRAETMFGQALAADSTYAPAYVGLAGSKLVLGLEEGELDVRMEMLEDAAAAAGKALELAPESREAREIMGQIELLREGPGASALGELPGRLPRVRVLVADSAGGAPGWFPTVTEVGRLVGAARAHAEAQTVAADARMRAVGQLEAVGQHREAVRILGDVLRADPRNVRAWDELEHLQVQAGELDRVAATRRDRAEALDRDAPPGAPSVDELERRIQDRGARGYWSWRLEELAARREAGRPVRPLSFAQAWAGLGDRDQALRWLREAAGSGDPHLASIRGDPVWDPYRQEPAFREVVQELFRIRVGAPRPPAPPGVGR